MSVRHLSSLTTALAADSHRAACDTSRPHSVNFPSVSLRPSADDSFYDRRGDRPLDRTDLKILRLVQAVPDISIMRLADEIGLSHTPCWRRLKRLEKEGIIAGHAKLLNADWLGFKVNVFASVKLQSHDEQTLGHFEQSAANCREIVECFSVTGHSDYMLRIITRSIEEYEVFLKKVLLHLPGVSAINSRFALKRIKLTTMLPL
jgi:Lrp/AsnC family transcriptional regulator